MIGFTSVALNEFSAHTPALDQTIAAIPAVIGFSMLITLATIMPKLVSGSSLRELLDVASSGNLKGEGVGMVLALFDTNFELWSGRMAMFGFAGLILFEEATNASFF
jgi:hypothetical protein